MRSRTASSSRRASSGSRSARSSIEPLRSAKSTVTCLRSPTRVTPVVRIFSARCWGVYACGEAAAAAPSSRFPHSLQKRAPPGFSCPHPGHFMAKSLLCGARPNKTGQSRASPRGPRRSAGMLRQPVAHGAREPREADRRRTQVLEDTFRVDAQIAVHQDVAEAAEPLQLLPERGLDDAVRAELGDDVLVVRGADP